MLDEIANSITNLESSLGMETYRGQSSASIYKIHERLENVLEMVKFRGLTPENEKSLRTHVSNGEDLGLAESGVNEIGDLLSETLSINEIILNSICWDKQTIEKHKTMMTTAHPTKDHVFFNILELKGLTENVPQAALAPPDTIAAIMSVYNEIQTKTKLRAEKFENYMQKYNDAFCSNMSPLERKHLLSILNVMFTIDAFPSEEPEILKRGEAKRKRLCDFAIQQDLGTNTSQLIKISSINDTNFDAATILIEQVEDTIYKSLVTDIYEARIRGVEYQSRCNALKPVDNARTASTSLVLPNVFIHSSDDDNKIYKSLNIRWTQGMVNRVTHSLTNTIEAFDVQEPVMKWASFRLFDKYFNRDDSAKDLDYVKNLAHAAVIVAAKYHTSKVVPHECKETVDMECKIVPDIDGVDSLTPWTLLTQKLTLTNGNDQNVFEYGNVSDKIKIKLPRAVGVERWKHMCFTVFSLWMPRLHISMVENKLNYNSICIAAMWAAYIMLEDVKLEYIKLAENTISFLVDAKVNFAAVFDRAFPVTGQDTDFTTLCRTKAASFLHSPENIRITFEATTNVICAAIKDAITSLNQQTSTSTSEPEMNSILYPTPAETIALAKIKAELMITFQDEEASKLFDALEEILTSVQESVFTGKHAFSTSTSNELIYINASMWDAFVGELTTQLFRTVEALVFNEIRSAVADRTNYCNDIITTYLNTEKGKTFTFDISTIKKRQKT